MVIMGHMDEACAPPFLHYAWLGTWRTDDGHGSTVAIHMRQVAHCCIYTSRAKADVRRICRGLEDQFGVAAGSVQFAPADGEAHTLIHRCHPGHQFYMLLIPRAHLQSVTESEGLSAMTELRPSLAHHDTTLTSCMARVSRYADDPSGSMDGGKEVAARRLILRLMEINGCRRPEWTTDASVFERKTLENLVAYIDEHLRLAPSLSDMSVHVGLSPSHFAKKFRQSTGLSLHRFINRRRLGKSLELLKANTASLTGIALDLGFASQSHFTRLFSGHTGMTPAKYHKHFKFSSCQVFLG
jgi:AraC-like DNA-binding protein